MSNAPRVCHFCKREVPYEGRILRTETCPWCRSDLHCCMNCKHHKPSAYNECEIPNTDRVQHRERANHCGEFTFREGAIAEDKTKEQALNKLSGLFKL